MFFNSFSGRLVAAPSWDMVAPSVDLSARAAKVNFENSFNIRSHRNINIAQRYCSRHAETSSSLIEGASNTKVVPVPVIQTRATSQRLVPREMLPKFHTAVGPMS